MTTPATPTTPATTTPAAAPATKPGNTIHDAVDALFAEKAAKPVDAPAAPEKPQEVATAAADGNQPAAAQPDADPATEGETPPVEDVSTEPAAAPEPKLTAAEYAVQLARTRKKLAAAQAAAAAARTSATPAPSAEAIKRAAAIEAAGDDPLKRFEATGLDLAAVVQAFDNKEAEDPASADPLAKEVKTLRDELNRLQARESTQREVEAETSFMRAAEAKVKASPEFEYVAARGQDGLELVKELVLESAKAGKTLLIAEALKMAESHYSELAESLAKTKKLASKFQPSQTRKPGIAQQAPVAGAAPATQTKPKSVRDVINQELDALMG